MLLAVARQAGVTVVLTEDLQDGQEYDGLRCVNPFGRTTAELTTLLRR
jgi:predicted nucleic acid-binding protein